MLRVKESEVQYLKQEINSLKDELQTAQRVSATTSCMFEEFKTKFSRLSQIKLILYVLTKHLPYNLLFFIYEFIYFWLFKQAAAHIQV